MLKSATALHIVALDDPPRLLDRVAQRVREGGPRLVAIRTATATTVLVSPWSRH